MFFKNWNDEYVTSLLKASLVGIHLVTATFVGLAIGYFLDKWLKTKPVFTIIFLLFGIAAGYKNMYMEIKGIYNKKNNENNSENVKNENDKK